MEAEALSRKKTPRQVSLKPGDRKCRLKVVVFLVGEEAGEGLPQAADGLGFGLVVRQAPS